MSEQLPPAVSHESLRIIAAAAQVSPIVETLSSIRLYRFDFQRVSPVICVIVAVGTWLSCRMSTVLPLVTT